MKTCFIGAGRTGRALAKYLETRGVTVTGFYDKNGGGNFADIPALAAASDAIFITVPDDEIASVWQQLKKENLKNKNICHCSGTLTSQVFEGIEKSGARGFSVHPLAAVSGPDAPLDNIWFTIEGAEPAAVKPLFKNHLVISPEQKPRYHAAAVFISNFVTALASAGGKEFAARGVPEAAWKELFFANAANIYKDGIIPSLTGPVERGDGNTVAAHLAVLDGENKEIYKILSKVLLKLAKEKHPGKNYKLLEKELK